MTAAAQAATPIEGVWSFNGGEVAIQGLPDGTYQGTVVQPTKFSQCYHPIGEHVWSGITEQPDGSYFGLHQWYFATAACQPNPVLGLTAWRILPGPEGGHFLRVCFSEPGSTSQPTIGADGVSAGATYGCEDSARVSGLPGTPTLVFPSGKTCLRKQHLIGRAGPAAGDPLDQVTVGLSSGKLRRRAHLRTIEGGSVIARLKLRHLPQRAFTVRATVSTVLGSTASFKRRYHLCPSRSSGS